jgi:malonyl-CoA/methylmalonyl-CoA synthetase
MNLYTALRRGFPADLRRLAVETCDGPLAPARYTWGDLERGSAMMANLLQSLDLPRSADGAPPIVAAQVDKSVEALMLYLAVLRAGFAYLPLNTGYTAAELEHFLRDAEPAVFVCDDGRFQSLSRLAFGLGVRHVYTLNDDRTGLLLARAAHFPDTQAPVARDDGDLACILYTSGTTGRSKGAMLSHGNMLSNAQVLKAFWGWRDAEADGGDVLVHALPLFHIHGLFVACHGALLAGARLLWFQKFEPRAVIERLAEASVFMGVPTLYTRLLAEPALTPQACAGMRLFVSGSAPLLPATFEAWRQRTGHTIVERYGMSETVMLTSNPYHARDGGVEGRRAGTVGRPLPGVQLRVVDGQGQPCPTGEAGGVEVRGPGVFGGYWRLPDKTAESFSADGWFRTGDVGRLDGDGVLQIVGRSKDLIISGGYNVYPAEVESELDAQPGVAESAVVGVPHPDFGEGVVAVVVPQPGAALDEAALIAAVRGRLAAYKCPKRVFVAPELPRNAMGKVQKNLLREQHQGLFSTGGRT